jgi:hypothetical protein
MFGNNFSQKNIKIDKEVASIKEGNASPEKNVSV